MQVRQRLAIALLTMSILLPTGFLAFNPSPRARAADEKKAPATFEVYKDKAGEFRWRLRATNSQIIATSGDGYKEKRSCLSAIESVKRDAPLAPVHEQE
jgi:uncharacterized protein YegP (UPF0339 family)